MSTGTSQETSASGWPMIVRIARVPSTSGGHYNAIRLHVGDLCFTRDLVNTRDIRQAKKLADSYGAEFWVSPDMQAQVDTALAEGCRRG